MSTEPQTPPATEATPRPAPTHRLRLAGARAIAERLAPELRADPPTALRLAEWFEAHAAYPQAAESYQAALADPHQLGAWHGTARHLARAGRWRPLAAHLDAMSRAPLPRAHRVEALGELGHLLRTRLDAPAEADAVAHRIVLLTRPVWPRVLLAIAFLLTLALFAAVAYDLMRMHLP